MGNISEAMKKRDAHTSIEKAAQELIERMGDAAITVARERADLLRQGDDTRGHDQALRLLTSVEAQLNLKGSAE